MVTRSSKGDSKAPPCDGNKEGNVHPEHFRLQYHIYVMFLPEGDVSEDSYFEGVEKMAYPARIKNHGQKVSLTKKENTIKDVKTTSHVNDCF